MTVLLKRLDVKMKPNYDPEQFTAGWANCTLRSKTNSPYILLIGSILSLFTCRPVSACRASPCVSSGQDEHEAKTFLLDISLLHFTLNQFNSLAPHLTVCRLSPGEKIIDCS